MAKYISSFAELGKETEKILLREKVKFNFFQDLILINGPNSLDGRNSSVEVRVSVTAIVV